MSETKKSKSWPVIGSLRKGDSGSYIKLADGVDIYVNGEKISLNEKKTIRLEDPRAKVGQLFERGFITEAEHDKRLETLANLTWLKYDLVAAPAKPKNT